MLNGYATLVLHNHLPYVIGHGMWPHGMDWLNEAAAETYIPLIDMTRRLLNEGIRARITMGVTPVLTEQLADGRFKQGFDSYLEQKIEAAEEDAKTFISYGNDHRRELAARWRSWYQHKRRLFNEEYDRDLVAQLRKLQDEGAIEIITCAATHGYLPLIGRDECVRAQIMTGVESYRRHYGRDPRGIWLPECAYRPRYAWKPPVGEETEPVMRAGVEEFLHDAGIKYFFVDTHLLQGGEAIGVYLERFEGLQQLWKQFEQEYHPREIEADKKPYGIYYASSTGGKKPVAIFARDPQTTVQVWSGEHGYPGNGAYLDFHKKHYPGGHRYWRVTSAKSDLADKEVYDPAPIEGIILEQSEHFVHLLANLLRENRNPDGAPGLVCSPYDGELYGHWWFEGPQWLEATVRKLDAHPEVQQATASEAMEAAPPHRVVNIPEGSWGEGGFHYIWFNDWTSWTWRHIYEAENAMVETARQLDGRKGPAAEIAEQMARELLLLESSDWQFLISTWSARDYAEARVDRHARNFRRLRAMVDKLLKGEELQPTEMNFYETCRSTNSIFEIKLEHWSDPVSLE